MISASMQPSGRRLLWTAAATAVTVLTIGATSLDAQSLAQRIANVGDGTVHMSFAARPDVCGNGRGNITIQRGHSRTVTNENSWSRDVEWEYECDYGPVRLALDVRDRNVVAIRTYVGGRWRSGVQATDLGMVSAREATDYLLGLAENSGSNGATSKASRDAVFATILADSVTVWPRLAKIARSEGIPRETRRNAVFWLGQAAGDKITDTLGDMATESSLDRDVREQAVFALSQRPREEGVPKLIQIARTNKDGEVRKKALFWLGQSGDPRAVALFEEILSK